MDGQLIQPYLWYLMVMTIGITNMVVSMFIYYFLQSKGDSAAKIRTARDMAFFYSLAMMFVIILATGAFIMIIPF